jgi:hypothetical protein
MTHISQEFRFRVLRVVVFAGDEQVYRSSEFKQRKNINAQTIAAPVRSYLEKQAEQK